jgi:hypothetical protein
MVKPFVIYIYICVCVCVCVVAVRELFLIRDKNLVHGLVFGVSAIKQNFMYSKMYNSFLISFWINLEIRESTGLH